MFGNDRELTWLENNKEAAMAAPTWDAFCDTVQPLGNVYRKYGWLQRHWEFLKLRGFLMFRTIKYPEARAFTDLFVGAKMAQKSPGPDWFYLSEQHIEPSICGSYSGRRGWSDGRGGTATHGGDGKPIRCHYGAKFYHVYVRVRPGVEVPQFFDCGKSNLQAIRHEDGKILITAESPRYIGSEWLAYLDEGDSLESLLPTEDQEFLAAERKAESEAWPETTPEAK